ncbi:MAG TPA: hypothetical protein VJ904_09335 [Tichowtungia sp.]|nr:hypothetical protein [Tichowtungia sp.]
MITTKHTKYTKSLNHGVLFLCDSYYYPSFEPFNSFSIEPLPAVVIFLWKIICVYTSAFGNYLRCDSACFPDKLYSTNTCPSATKQDRFLPAKYAKKRERVSVFATAEPFGVFRGQLPKVKCFAFLALRVRSLVAAMSRWVFRGSMNTHQVNSV